MAPTAIPGVERKRVTVTPADIARLAPGVTSRVAERAVRLVEGFVVEGARDREVVLWGHAAQQAYAGLVSGTLELARADVLSRVRTHVGRMVDLLGAVDIEAICGVAPRAGLLGRYFARGGRAIDTPSELDAARRELDQLVALTGAALDPLVALRDALAQQSRKIDAAGDELEAAALSAAFLAECLRETRPELARRFLERSMSLTESVAQVRGSGSLRELQIEEPLRLIAAIQKVALVTLPGWLGSVTALAAASRAASRPTATQAGELAYQLRTILHQLTT